jgi:hypothetical protein
MERPMRPDVLVLSPLLPDRMRQLETSYTPLTPV